MEIKEVHLKIGGEVDFGYYGEFGKNRFRLSLRLNKETGQYELYKHFFRTLTSQEEHEDVLMSSTDLKAVVQEADRLATGLSGEEWKDTVVLDENVCN